MWCVSNIWRVKPKMIALLVLLILLLSLSMGCGSATNPPNKSTGRTEDVGPTENTESTENIEPTETGEDITTDFSTDAETESEEMTEEDTTVSTQEATEESTEKSTEEATSKAPVVEIRVPIEEIKEPLHTFSWGAESGQLGWRTDFVGDCYGPSYFVIEDGILYVTDDVNGRIVIVEDGRCREIKIGESMFTTSFIYQNQMIAWTGGGCTISIYRKDGTLVYERDNTYIPNRPDIFQVVEIGETYVVWSELEDTGLGFDIKYYRYDWVQDSGAYVEPDQLNVEYLKTVEINVPVRRDMVEVLGMDETGIYYFYPEMGHYLLCRETDDTQWITAWDFSGEKPQLREPFYYSEDGELYLMECFEDQIVISKLTLE